MDDEKMKSQPHVRQLKGKICENIVSNDLMNRGFSVFTSHENGNPVDLIASKENISLRFQVKSSQIANGKVKCWTRRSNTRPPYDINDFDYFAHVLPNANLIFYQPIETVDLNKKSSTIPIKDLKTDLKREHR
jgi:predicted AAA+ superfamily ATPase|tara:strand:+ start:295 stop:693 length:399 start_codon:yes stop_codon:yes gene_type:complete